MCAIGGEELAELIWERLAQTRWLPCVDAYGGYCCIDRIGNNRYIGAIDDTNGSKTDPREPDALATRKLHPDRTYIGCGLS
jgi:hypothetical protein